MLELEEDDAPAGTPAWMATFADLMSLLMCFFVLLLSFSEMDVQKYKQVAGSMKQAFGVQNQVKVMDIPKGTSIIAKEFSPGKTTPTPIDTVNQVTAETTKASLQVGDPKPEETREKGLNDEQTQRLLEEKLQGLIAETKADAEKLGSVLSQDIKKGKIEIETEGRNITIRIQEKGSFPSGSATLHPDFSSTITELRDALKDIKGKISVEGHTDNVPITSGRFTSNWELSASRATSVTHELVKDDILDSSRFVVVGHAATQPYLPNDTPENRSRNRRVEIIIRQGLDNATTDAIQELQKVDPGIMNTLTIQNNGAAGSVGGSTAEP